jgi:aspartyl/glutamyl-tRNA(Asn/Gln) amidotransferase C subunit
VPDSITPEIFRHLVDLAALELDEDEAEYLRRQLNGQLKAIAELESIELAAETTVTSHGVPYPDAIRPPLRPDDVRPAHEADDILAQAPATEDRYIVVPDIPHTELE